MPSFQWEIDFWDDSPVKRDFRSLPLETKKRLKGRIENDEEKFTLNEMVSLGRLEHIGKRLCELRFHLGKNQFRFLGFVKGNIFYALEFFPKKQNKIDPVIIERANNRLKKIKETNVI
ncbi:MAG: type II toxin-antitoxin system RelE/ParE family toxin [Candidatus Colwellbacteria bacterium]|nr:type II toxin-antitoxin system RelE/ParE family toxin [Candidatus Colwellbacteria bacterium]